MNTLIGDLIKYLLNYINDVRPLAIVNKRYNEVIYQIEVFKYWIKLPSDKKYQFRQISKSGLNYNTMNYLVLYTNITQIYYSSLLERHPTVDIIGSIALAKGSRLKNNILSNYSVDIFTQNDYFIIKYALLNTNSCVVNPILRRLEDLDAFDENMIDIIANTNKTYIKYLWNFIPHNLQYYLFTVSLEKNIPIAVTRDIKKEETLQYVKIFAKMASVTYFKYVHNRTVPHRNFNKCWCISVLQEYIIRTPTDFIELCAVYKNYKLFRYLIKNNGNLDNINVFINLNIALISDDYNILKIVLTTFINRENKELLKKKIEENMKTITHSSIKKKYTNLINKYLDN